MTIETMNIGGNHGIDFDIQAIHSIGFQAGTVIEAVVLNDERFGEKQGTESNTLELHPDEYINSMVIHGGEHKEKQGIYGIELTTSLGRKQSAGTLHGKDGKVTTLQGIRVLGIGGSIGSALHKLRIRYIPDYKESALIARDIIAVTNIIPQGLTIESFTSRRVSKLEISRRLLETVTKVEASSEISATVGEFTAKASRSFGLTVTTQKEFTRQVEEETVESERSVYAAPAGHVGLEVVSMDVFRASDGTTWFFPRFEPQLVSAPVSGENKITQDLYDMTGTLSLHLPYMADQRFGYDHFETLELV